MSPRAARNRRLGVTGAVVAALLLTLSTAAAAVEVAGLTVVRADAPGTDTPEFVLPLLPGGSAVRSVLITNTSQVDVTVLVYGADASPTDAGLAIADGTDNTSLGAWLVTEEPTQEVAPGATVEASFRVTRPSDDEDGGMGAVVIQLSDTSREQLGQPTVQRAAIPVLVAADGTGESITLGAVRIEGDEAVVAVTNSTPAAVTLVGEVLRDGLRGERVLARLGTRAVAPGRTVVLRTPLDDDVGGSALRRPFLRVTDAAGTLEGPRGDAPRGLLVGGFLLLAAAAGATAVTTRRQRPRRTAPEATDTDTDTPLQEDQIVQA